MTLALGFIPTTALLVASKKLNQDFQARFPGGLKEASDKVNISFFRQHVKVTGDNEKRVEVSISRAGHDNLGTHRCDPLVFERTVKERLHLVRVKLQRKGILGEYMVDIKERTWTQWAQQMWHKVFEVQPERGGGEDLDRRNINVTAIFIILVLAYLIGRKTIIQVGAYDTRRACSNRSSGAGTNTTIDS
jgi:hypothetical protein